MSDQTISAEKIKKVPNPIDRHVGSRVRMRRVILGMRPGELGEALGLTFQQVQKYEKGANQIGASRLQQISRTLDVPAGVLFRRRAVLRSSGGRAAEPAAALPKTPTSYVLNFLSTAEGQQLNMAFARKHAEGSQADDRSGRGAGRRGVRF